MHRAPHNLPVFGEDGLDVGLGHHGCVEVADEDAGVEGARVILVGHVAGLGLPSHPSNPAALPAGRHSWTLLRKPGRSDCGVYTRKTKQRAPVGRKHSSALRACDAHQGSTIRFVQRCSVGGPA